jgi:hypothetical protein
VLWAQRSSASEPEKNYIYLTISVPDVPKSSMKLDLKPTGLSFTGTSDTKKTTYHLDLEFFDEIDVENSKTIHTARDIEIVLRKKELKEEFWPRLLKDKAKVHFLKTDFDKVGKNPARQSNGICLTLRSGLMRMSKTRHQTMTT